MNIFKNLFGTKEEIDFKKLVNEGAVIIDVRTPQEYRQGHVSSSMNIPLDEIRMSAFELRKKHKRVITVCRSGARSGTAESILSASGIECYNGGPWDSLEKKIK